jgi:hypothetical protein
MPEIPSLNCTICYNVLKMTPRMSLKTTIFGIYCREQKILVVSVTSKFG